jgi:hypothetical protein
MLALPVLYLLFGKGREREVELGDDAHLGNESATVLRKVARGESLY